ncbi:DUF3016 domain-containing protein [Alteromonas sp. 5E99-2]|uniref:DUF3016 domain-containing protein n=1 Tax=Alteromonas sp. 5E99-2 TaxID=2817683 RepID=UPI001A983877|nr:DUF3016 domain-containing protein [Alteromonas sp. 5E99-2]MBO1257013.1 DUF3016 domain-containing protein [Alteromonas sp. 5E99-2]
MRVTGLVFLMAYSTLLSFALCAKEKSDTNVIEDTGRVHIIWESPKKYRDVRPSNQSPSRFREYVFNEFDEKFEALATDLPEGFTLMLNITNVDLAGDVSFGGASSSLGRNFGSTVGDIRVIERVFIPSMAFSYQVFDEKGNEVLAADEKIKDTGFLQSSLRRGRDGPFVYEKRMLERWYKNEITPHFSGEVTKS